LQWHLVKQQDPKICHLSHNITVDETTADERLLIVRLRSSWPEFPPKCTWFFKLFLGMSACKL
jgi:hypothetical protein